MKKNVWKKTLAALLAAGTVLTTLSACGGSSAESTSDGDTASSVPSGEVITWRLQSNYALDSLEGDMAKNLKESLEKATNGRLQVELAQLAAIEIPVCIIATVVAIVFYVIKDRKMIQKYYK